MEQKFELKSFKIDPFFGVDCKYRLSETENEVTTEQDFHVKISRPIHADLENLFLRDLRRILAKIINTTEDLADIDLGRSRLYPFGISFAGKGDNVGILIYGERHTKFGRIKFKTPRIKYLTGESDVCAELTKFADAVKAEIQAYLFESKSAELEVFE